MKNSFFLYLTLIISFIMLSAETYTVRAQQKQTSVSGLVVDSKNNKPLPGVSVSVNGSNIGTVTNQDGYFALTIKSIDKPVITFSALGYSIKTLPADNIVSSTEVIRMERKPIQLSEVIIYGGDPELIVTEALRKIPDNYSATKDMLSMFYRETVSKGRRFVGVSEASMHTYKTPYQMRDVYSDRVAIDRGRRLMSQQSSDTIAVKIVGGPNLSVFADFVKNYDMLLTEEDIFDYKFRMEDPVYIDDRPNFVISFKPRMEKPYMLYVGKLYVDCELLAFTRAEFEMDPSDKSKIVKTVLVQKPRGLRFSPQKIDFVVSYRQINGKTYLHYICQSMKFKCEMKRRLFSSAYTVNTEMVVVDQEHDTDKRISRKEAFYPRQVFYDRVDEYWDEDYWKDYNIIEPSESLENAVYKLKKKYTSSKH